MRVRAERASLGRQSEMAASVDFIKGATNRYRSVLHRPDGVDVGFEGGSYNELGGGRAR